MIKTILFTAIFLITFLTDFWVRAEPAKPFMHPRMLYSQSELTFIKGKITTGEEPWKYAWEQLKRSKEAFLKRSPLPIANVVRGARNRPDIGSSDMTKDAAAAYAHALLWSLSGKQAHAEITIETLNAWSRTLESVGSHDAMLLIGMDDVSFCNAAELIRHWSEQHVRAPRHASDL